ncbi:MAG: PKD domain-containing protein [Flavobacteriales bacterium]|nr:PKD domain-containing protein [Flavobacteriales bacterium]
MKKYILLFTVLIGLFVTKAYAQPANNTCATATTLTVTNGSCSSTNYTNVGATTTGNPATPACWSPNNMSHTVWFKFVATSTSVQVSTNFGYALLNTQLAAYSGSCGSLTNIGCNEDINTAGGLLHTSLQLHGLTVGNTYFLIVDGNGNTTGEFGICVEQIAPIGPPSPINDCQTGQFLCDKNAVSVPNGTGSPGLVQEMPTCFGSPGERASTWYTFTVGTSGTLCFTITPTSPVDYDWAFFNTTNGCMGTQMACNWSPNLGGSGATGANGAAGAQNAGCINVVAGQTYSILVDRFTATSSAGFGLSFGGTATFAAPNPSFTSNTACVGTATQFTNTTNGSNTYSWNFGDGFTSTAQNPTHTYAAAGTYSTSLLVTTNPGGCQNIVTQNVVVTPRPTVNAGADVTVCSGNCVNLAGSTNATGSVGPASFTNGGSYAIPDNNTGGVNSPITVSGISPATIAAGSIASVCVNLTHPFTGDVDMFLVCPGGTQLELSTDNGGGGDNYTNTCFSPTAGTNITAGTAPFTGTFLPEGNFTTLNGCNANGTWQLFVRDDAGGDVGSITGWTITFNNNLPPFTWTPTTNMTNSTTLTPNVCPTASTNYILTGTSGTGCTTSDTVRVTVSAPTTPTFAAVGPYCSGSVVPALPTTSTNGITGTWSPAINNTATTTYTFTPNAGQCAPTTTLTITITPRTTPTFAAVGPYCSGSAVPALPTTSTNGVTGTWSPAINNTATTTYTFTPTAGLCANTTTLTITITPRTTPTFAAVGPYCSGAAIAALPTTSTNGVTGTWSPAINNTATTTYTFTPSAGLCANTTTLTITINPNVTPTFAAVGPYCSGSAVPALPTTSTNGVTGTWSPAINNTATTTYTFTPTAGLCATTTTLTITITPQTVPTFTAVTPKCSGTAIAALPTTSNNGINGTWSPAINNTTTTTYTFTPTAGQCATTATMTITINTLPVPTVAADSVNCNGGSTGSVTVTGVTNSPGGFNYSWNTTPVQNTQTATGLAIGSYTVTVTDQNTLCTGQASITLNQPVVLSASETHVNPLCAQGSNGTATATPSGGTAPFSYSWNTTPVQTTQTATGLAQGSYTCTVTDYNGCTTTTTATLTDPAGMVLSSSMTQANCGLSDGSATVNVTSGGSGNFSYSWNTTPVQNTQTASNIPTGTYIATVTDVTLGCISRDTILVTTTTGITATTVFISDALCNGSSDGKAYAYPTGGSPVYTYSWNTVPVQTNDTVTAGAGTYTVTITDGTGCSGTANVTIGQPSVVNATITGSTNESCLGANNGTATAAGSGGTGAGYTFSWNTTPVQTTATATGLAPGTYIATVFDANLCPDTVSVTINPGPMMTASHTSTNVTCFGGSTGSITETISGAPGAITYNWMPGSIGAQNPVGLAAGTYYLTATSMGCSVNDTVIITQPTQMVAVIDSTQNVTCNGGSDGRAYASVTGGTGAYTYSWNTTPVQTTATAVGLMVGSYTLTVTDANLCQTTVNINITEPPLLAVNTGSINAYCGVNQGTVWANPTNGTAPYVYIWDSSSVVLGGTDTLRNLYPGSYHLQVLDANGCKFIGDVVVNAAPGGSAMISSTTPVSCFGGSNGTATVSMSGAFPPYTYQWDAAAGNQTTNPATGLSVGTYGVNVTDSYGCVMATAANITEPTQLSVALTQNNTVCPNSCDGTTTATPSGGTTPYTYSWNDPSTQVTPTASGLCLGTYTVQVTDNRGCIIRDSIVINNPPAMVITDTITPANCNQADGEAEVIVSSNGTAPFSFQWTSGATVLSTTSQLIGVAAGTYVATVTDFNGCSVTHSVTIPNLSGPQVDSSTFTNVLCFGGNNASATVYVSGGGFPYTYLWNDPLAQTTPSATNLTAGTYIVSVTDTNGCNLTRSFTINQPSDLVLTTGGTDPTCNGYADGFTWVNVVGGTTPYSYSWNDPLTQLNDSALNLPANAGGYTVTVTDSNGCVATDNVVLNDPALFTISVTGTPVSCFGGNNGTATVAETNGIAPFTYLWNDPSAQTSQTALSLTANTYNVVATDDDGCMANGSIVINEPPLLTIVQDTVLDVSCNGLSDGFASVTVGGGSGAYTFTWVESGNLVATSQSPNNLYAGSYVVTVTDTNNCTAQTIINVGEPSVLDATYATENVLCSGGNSGYAFVSASGGTSPYTYQWDANAALQQTDTAFNLVAGTYNMVVTDSNGCTFPINGIVITEPLPLNLVTSSVSSTCGASNGSASVSVGGGAGGYNYAWNTNPVQYTALASNIVAGNYTIVVTDINGCKDSTNVNVIDLGSPTVTIPTSTNVSCNGAADGTATASVSGGTSPYTYSWNTSPVQNTITATGLNAQTYNVTVTDSNGCIASASILIQQANALVAVIGAPTNVSCNGLSDGAATVMVAGGIAPFTYLWNDAATQTTATASSLVAGTYIVQVADSNNCLALDTVTITEPQVLVVGLDSLKHVNCFGGSDGYIDVNVTGGTFPYPTYTWTPNVSTGPTANGLTQGNYDVVVTDNNGCTATNSFVINEPLILSAVLDSIDATCGNSNGSATVTSTSGGTSPYIYSWNDPSNQQTITASNLGAATYSVTITDAKNCSLISSIVVNNLSGPIIDSIVKTNVLCFGETNGTANVFANGGSGLSYAWSPSAQITQLATGLAAGVYSVTVTDANGCSTTQGGINIAQPTVLTADINMPANACYGQTIQLFGVGNGGTPFAAPANPYNILWGPPFSVTSQGPLYDTVLTNTTYNIVVQDANGCNKFYNESVVVGSPLNISAADQTICQGQGISLTAATTGGNTANGYTYNWFVDNAGSYTTPAGVVNPTNPANVAPGTTTDYMVYVSDGCSRNDTTFVTVTVNDTSIVTFNSVLPGCPPLLAQLVATSTDAGLIYSWTFGDGGVRTTSNDTTIYQYNNSGSYDVYLTVTNASGCLSHYYSPKHVVVHQVPNADFTSDPQVVTILNPEVNFTDLSSSDVIGWHWNFGDLTTDLINQNPVHEYQDTGYYPVKLIVTNGNCLDSVIKYIRIKPDFFFAIPNTFTPDGDRLNELFMPGSLVGVSEKDYSFYIFDRWGEKIWEGHDLEDGWDGTVNGGSKIAQTDTYVWMIKLKGLDGLSREYRGHVNIIR